MTKKSICELFSDTITCRKLEKFGFCNSLKENSRVNSSMTGLSGSVFYQSKLCKAKLELEN